MYKINKGIISEKTGKKMTIFDGEESILYLFNETARFIFEKIKKGMDKKTIIDLLVNKYKVSKKTAEKDVEKIISELLKNKIISSLTKQKKDG